MTSHSFLQATSGARLQAPAFCLAVGSATASPIGTGSEFFTSLEAGVSGVRALNEVRDINASFLSQLRPLFTIQTILGSIPEGHPSRTQVVKQLTELAAAAGPDGKFDLPLSVVGAFIDGQIEELASRYYPDRPPRILEEETNGDAREHDAFGVVLNTDLYRFLLPISALLVRRFARQGIGVGVEPHLIDLLWLTLPRMAQMALTSNTLAVLDATGDGDAFERAVRGVDLAALAGASPTIPLSLRTDGTLDVEAIVTALAAQPFGSYLNEAVDELSVGLERSLWRLTRGGDRRIGFYLGTAGGNMEAGARLAGRVAHLGLTREIVARTTEGERPRRTILPDDASEDRRLELALFNDAQQYSMNYTAGLVCRALELEGEQVVLNAGCCSGAAAALQAARTIACGGAEVILACGADSAVWGEMYSAFYGIGVMASVEEPGSHEDACQPHSDEARGWVLGEGSSSVLLTAPGALRESRGDAVAITAGQSGNDAFRHPALGPRKHVLQRVFEATPDGQGLVLGYGLGDPKYDALEQQLVSEAAYMPQPSRPGRHFPVPPLASIKGQVSHSLAGSSMMALAVARWLLTVDAPRLHRVIDYADQTDTWSPVEDSRTVLQDLRWIVLNGSGMGGSSLALLVEPISELDV